MTVDNHATDYNLPRSCPHPLPTEPSQQHTVVSPYMGGSSARLATARIVREAGQIAPATRAARMQVVGSGTRFHPCLAWSLHHVVGPLLAGDRDMGGALQPTQRRPRISAITELLRLVIGARVVHPNPLQMPCSGDARSSLGVTSGADIRRNGGKATVGEKGMSGDNAQACS